MKTILPTAITTRAEAMSFLQALIDNGEAYHCEDDARDIEWLLPPHQIPTPWQCDQLNKLMSDIYNIEGNNGNHSDPKFDPCLYVITHDDDAIKEVKAIISRTKLGKAPNDYELEKIKQWVIDTTIPVGMGVLEIVCDIQDLFPKQYTEATEIPAKTYSLCEAVADIAFIAGSAQFYTGNSRADIANFISWATEFEALNKGVEWGITDSREYIDEITTFTSKKMASAQGENN